MANMSVWLWVSLHMKGWLWGTPGGALPPLTPTVTALTPWAYRMGRAALVNPGTSLCIKHCMPYMLATVEDLDMIHAIC